MRDLISNLSKNEQPKGRPILLCRHGETAFNKENLIRGWRDLELTPKGHEQAHELGEAIKDSGMEYDGIYASDLVRAEETALAISQETGIPILGEMRFLRPWNVGDYTGTDGEKAHKVMSDHARNHPEKELPNGESFNQFKMRYLMGLISLLNSRRGEKLIFVAHSRNERLAHAWVANECDPDLDIDLDTFLAPGEEVASAQEVLITSDLVLS